MDYVDGDRSSTLLSLELRAQCGGLMNILVGDQTEVGHTHLSLREDESFHTITLPSLRAAGHAAKLIKLGLSLLIPSTRLIQL